MAVSPDHAEHMVEELNGPESVNRAAIIGEVLEESPRRLYFE